MSATPNWTRSRAAPRRHRDLAEFLPLAAEIPLRPTVECYPLARANQALIALKHGPVRGAKVLRIG